MGDVMYDLKALMRAGERAITMVFKDRESFTAAAVNWADLHCIDARYCVHAEGPDTHVVIIEEAAPDNHEFQHFISEELAQLGFPNVEVVTEW